MLEEALDSLSVTVPDEATPLVILVAPHQRERALMTLLNGIKEGVVASSQGDRFERKKTQRYELWVNGKTTIHKDVLQARGFEWVGGPIRRWRAMVPHGVDPAELIGDLAGVFQTPPPNRRVEKSGWR